MQNKNACSLVLHVQRSDILCIHFVPPSRLNVTGFVLSFGTTCCLENMVILYWHLLLFCSLVPLRLCNVYLSILLN